MKTHPAVLEIAIVVGILLPVFMAQTPRDFGCLLFLSMALYTYIQPPMGFPHRVVVFATMFSAIVLMLVVDLVVFALNYREYADDAARGREAIMSTCEEISLGKYLCMNRHWICEGYDFTFHSPDPEGFQCRDFP